jgi:lycopene cyclase domain-containing protein
MTYFGFLGIFLLMPIAALGALNWRNRAKPALPRWAIPLLCLLALAYTTPWDNYLVATGVWWYDPNLVTGIVLGWVPVEEYTFFVLQPILTGLWINHLIRSISPTPTDGTERARRGAVILGGLAWLAGVGLLLSGWRPGTYLGLLLAWALLPVLIQFAFGADILLKHARLAAWGILIPTLYLAAADALAIGWGTWTIDPAQSTGILLGGILPVEELVFFLLTNVLVTLGLVLVWAPESRARLAARRGRRA